MRLTVKYTLNNEVRLTIGVYGIFGVQKSLNNIARVGLYMLHELSLELLSNFSVFWKGSQCFLHCTWREKQLVTVLHTGNALHQLVKNHN